MSNLVTRTITGLLFISAMIGALLYSTDTTLILFGIFVILSLREITALLKEHTRNHISIVYTIFLGTVLFFTYSAVQAEWVGKAWLGILFPLFAISFVLALMKHVNTPIESTALSWFSIAYVVIPLLLMTQLRAELGSGKELVGMFVVIWTNDTMAYVSGRLFGKTKLIERISPKKTWEGTIGGIFFSLAAGIAWSIFVSGLSLDFWIFVSPLVALSAIYGDLFESSIKRQLGVKDSGNLLPGHGGLLDRFDATFMAAPVFYGVYHIFEHIKF